MPARPNLLWKAPMKSEANNIHLTFIWRKTHYFLYTKNHRWCFKITRTHESFVWREGATVSLRGNRGSSSWIKMSWPFSAHIIDHVSAGPIYQNTRGAETLTAAVRCPVLKPTRWGEGLHNPLLFMTHVRVVGFPFNAIFTDDLHVNALTCKTNDAIAFASIRST